MKKTLRFLALTLVTVMICAAFVSCGAPRKNPDDALAALKENGVDFAFKDENSIPNALDLFGIDDVDCVVTGTGVIDEKYAHITIIYFEDADSAKEEYDKVIEYAERYKKDTKDSNWVFKKSGNMIYYGTKDAIRAAK